MVEPIKFGTEPTIFPVMSGQEDPATSILFAMMDLVYPLRNALLSSIGKSAYKSGGDFECLLRPSIGGRLTRKDIPDAFIQLHQRTAWKAFVEVKIGAAELDNVQLSNYLHRSLEHKVDALITVSNELCTDPSHPPLRLKPAEKKLRKIPHFHWSWRFIQKTVHDLIEAEDVEEHEEALLKHFLRFLTHEKSGVGGFREMPLCWSEFVDTLRDGGTPAEEDIEDVIAGWFQECAEIAIILSEELSLNVEEVVSAKTVEQRRENAVKGIKSDGDLTAQFVVDGDTEFDICLDVDSRCVRFSAEHKPTSRVSTPHIQIEHFVKQFYVAGAPEEYGSHSDVRIFAKWPHAPSMTDLSMTDAILDTVEETMKSSSLIRQDKDKLSKIILQYTPSKVSSKIRSRKNVINLLEEHVSYFVQTYVLVSS